MKNQKIHEYCSSRNFDEKQSIDLFINIADKLSNLHKKDLSNHIITPDVIFMDVDTGEINLSVPLKTDDKKSENGTSDSINIKNIMYISPEKTGRASILPDYRSDYYSLGIIFYEMLTGEPPFSDTEPSDIIHAHIAKRPTPPYKKKSSISRITSDIIMKLLEKDPDNRYQSGSGLLYDLRFCHNQLEKPGSAGSFRTGLHDVSPLFRIPDKLYGRHKEIQMVVNEFSKVEKGAAQYLFVTGSPGIGKSFFINETRHLFTRKGGYFISGKFEQYSLDLPYSAFIRAFRELIRQLLTESEEKLAIWKKKIIEAVGINGKIVTDIIPELIHIIGLQKEVDSIPPQEAQNRFNFVFHNFVQAFAGRKHPLVIFIDDIQWADRASVRLMELFHSAAAISSVLCIIAYRDIELQENIPAVTLMQTIQKDKEKAHIIMLEPVNAEYISSLLEDTLYSEIEEDNDLIKMLLEKTNGNPLYIKELLLQLYGHGYIYLNEDSSGITGWNYDIEKIPSAQIPDNLISIITQRIRLLPLNIQDTLKAASCISTEFTVELLAELLSSPVSSQVNILKTCVKENLIFIQNNKYRFMHDKIQESIYQLLTKDETTLLHYRIGVLLQKKDKAADEYLFDIVTHLNQALPLIESEEEKTELCKLNYYAGLKAKKSNAYDFTAELFKTGISLLGKNSWNNNYNIVSSLYKEYMECESINLNFTESESAFNILIKNLNSDIEKAEIYSLSIQLHNIRGEYKTSIDHAIKGLNILNNKIFTFKGSIINFIIELIKFRIYYINRNIESVLQYPHIDDIKMITASRILVNASIALSVENINASLTLLFQVHNYYLKSRSIVIEDIPLNFMGVALATSTALNDYNLAYNFGESSLQAVEKFDNIKIKGRVYFLFSFMIIHWKKHARHSIEYFLEAFNTSFRNNDFFSAINAISFMISNKFIIGNNLDEIQKEFHHYKKIFTQFFLKNNVNMIYYEKEIYFINRMIFESYKDDINTYETDSYLIENNSILSIFYLQVNQMKLDYFFKVYDRLLVNIPFLEKNTKSVISSLILPEYNFYYSLSITLLWETMSRNEKIKYKKILKKNQRMMKKWSLLCKENFQHKFILVQAEIARVLDSDQKDETGKRQKADVLYNKAIKSAGEQNYINNEAIANECFAKYYLSKHIVDKARIYITAAYRCYEQWGAIAKCRNLAGIYPQFFVKSGQASYNANIDGVLKHASNESDLISFSSLDLKDIQFAIKNVSNENELEQSIKKILRVICSSSGAQRATILFYSDNEMYLYGTIESITSTEEIYDLKYGKLETISFPETIVRFVKRTGDAVILGNATEDERFCKDPYIEKILLRSALCIPLLKMENREIIIYLENNQLINVFNPKRMNIIDTITTQLKTVLENLMLKELHIKNSQHVIKENIPIEDILQQDYDLTIQEVRIALMLKDGISRQSACDELAITHKTLQNHLNSIYSKTINNNDDEFATTGRIDKLSRFILFLMELEKG